ncbi:hypothetical protein [Halomarina rubra]|uniref:Uncharacterized protein n=1 Tax=Halomarina rubra TaxID=2071873 RepID=A0ABD6B2N0_9EURY|nr:hypothetical protein [Halomarina rubra]
MKRDIPTEDGTVPTITTRDDQYEYYNACERSNVPSLCVDALNGVKYGTVEYDMLPAQGWTVEEVEYGNSTMDWECKAHITEDGMREINRIAHTFEDAEFKDKMGHTALTKPHGFSYSGYPKMKIEHAEKLARELAPVVFDDDNWEVPGNTRARFDL